MGHWELAACLGVAVAGVLVFLALVAQELRLLNRSIKLQKNLEAERQARQCAQEC